MQRVTGLLNLAQADSTYKSDMFVEIVKFTQSCDTRLGDIITDEQEKEKFVSSLEKRTNDLTDMTDELCFALDQRRDFMSAYEDEENRARVYESLRQFAEIICLFSPPQRAKVMRDFRKSSTIRTST